MDVRERLKLQLDNMEPGDAVAYGNVGILKGRKGNWKISPRLDISPDFDAAWTSDIREAVEIVLEATEDFSDLP